MNSLSGAMLISDSLVQMNNVTFSQNTGAYSSMTVSSSVLVFDGDNSFNHNSGQIANIFATNSNFTFHSSTSFVNNIGGPQFGLAGMYLSGCQLYNFGDIRFWYNSGLFVLSVSESVFVSEGLLEFIGNEVGKPDAFQEATLFISMSTFTVESFRFVRNQGAAYFYNSPFIVVNKLEVLENLLIQDYSHATFTLFGSSVSWTGNVLFSNNVAKLGGTAGIKSYSQTIHAVGNVSIVSNSADFNVGLQVLDGSLFQLHGSLVIRNNSVLLAAGGLTLISSAVYVDGLLHISENTASSVNSSVIVAQNYSVINVTGSFEFLSNKGVDRAFCILFVSSQCIVNGRTLIQGSVADRSPHFFQNSDITFVGVSQIRNNIVTDSYGGGLALSQSVLRLNDSYFFENNQSPTDNGGAIYAIDSQIIFSGTGNFISNSAMRGGALQLFFRSRIILLSGLSLIFSENTALTGGAFHVEEVVSFINCTNDIRLRFTYAEPPTCFFDTGFADNVNLIFNGNKATDGGSALYGGMLKRCILTNHSALEVFMSISNFNSSNELSLSSDPFQLCFCEDQIPNCNLKQITVYARRGEQFSVSIIALNELEVGIVALVRSYLVSGFNDTDKILGDEGILQKVDSQCTDLRYRVSSANEAEQLTMYAEGPCRDVGNASKIVQVTFEECPIGFMLDIDTCVCGSQLLPFTNTCNVDTGGIARVTNFWIGTEIDSTGNFTGLVLYPNCPFDYCLFPSPEVELVSPDTQCNYNRSGVLCGSCQANSSLLLGSSACSECSNYYLFLLIPFAVMGVVLIACLFLLQLTVAAGALHGLIFYANIVTVNKAILVPPNTFKGLTIFLSWLNLDFGIETCFFDGLNQYVKTWLEFAFPLYLLFLVFLIIIICHYSIKTSRFFGSNPVAVLATVILLSYTKVLRTILAVFSFATLEHSTKSESSTSIVWLLDGNLNYTRGNHAILFAISLLLLLVLILPYTLLLLTAQLLMKVSCISSGSLFKRLVPFIDAYHAPYKPNHRYWTGLFLLVRGILLTTFAINSLGNPSINLLAITTLCFCTASLSWLLGGVYKKTFLEAFEALFILNLGVFATATHHTRATEGKSQSILANISLSFSFLLFLSIVGGQIYNRLLSLIKYLRLRWYKDVDIDIQRNNVLLEVSAEDYGAAHGANNPTVQIVPPPARKSIEMSFSGLRESLLEDN